LVAGEGGDSAAVGGEAVYSVGQRLRGEMQLDMVRGEQDLVGLNVHWHLAAGGAAVAAGDRGSGGRRG
jgi:hypothetical protein